MKRIMVLFFCICLMASLMAGCAEKSDPLDLSVSTTGDSGGEEPVTGSGPETEPPLPEVPAIVFDETIDNPIPGSGLTSQASLKMILYETSPGVFAGDGILETSENDSFGSMSKKTTITIQKYSFQDLKPGDTGQYSAFIFKDREESYGKGRGADMGAYITHTQCTRFMPAEYSFTLDGGQAVMTFNTLSATIEYFDFAFNGSYTTAPIISPDTGQLDGRCISVNSTFIESGKDYIRESRLMLTATLVSGLEYTGDFCAYGSGTGRPYIDEAANFTLEIFEEQAYKSAGGSLPGSFDAFGVIESSGGDYIVLIDGERAIVEDVSSDAVFTGELLPAAEADSKMKLANDSKRLMKHLYDNPYPSQYSRGGFAEVYNNKPPWYPDWLMPEPVGANYWGWRNISNITSAYTYEVSYGYHETMLPPDVFEAYKLFFEDLGGVEIYHDDRVGGGEQYALFYFSEGVFSFEVEIAKNMRAVNLIIV